MKWESHNFRKVTVRKTMLIVTLFTFFFSYNCLAQFEVSDKFTSGNALDLNAGVQFSLIQSDVALPGSDMHLWLQTNLQGVLDTVPVKYVFVLNSMPDDNKWLDMKGMASDWASSFSGRKPTKNGNSIERSGEASIETCCFFPAMPPMNPGTTIGDTTKVINQCTEIDTSGTLAEVEYDWKWQYTKDTNNDGKNDSDPGWVLVAVGITLLNNEAAALCSS